MHGVESVQKLQLLAGIETGEILNTRAGRENLNAFRAVKQDFLELPFSSKKVVQIEGRGNPEYHINIGKAQISVEDQDVFSEPGQ